MQHVADRAAILAALKEAVCRYQAWGLERPANSSMREYLTSLAELGAAPRDVALAAANIYDDYRFGSATIAPDQIQAVIASLEAAAADLASLEENERSALAEMLRERFAPRKAVARPSPSWAPPPQFEDFATPQRRREDVPNSQVLEARRRKQQAERGPSRLWTFVSAALVLWTLMVMAGSIWQIERIEDALTRTEWGCQILASLRGDEKPVPILRERMLREPRMATPSNFLRLAREYTEHREYSEAIYAYRQGLARCRNGSPEELLLLNNLAWLLLTVDDPIYRDPVQAEELADRCVNRHGSRAPEFLDTLALAYFQNGRLQDAVTLQEETVERAKQAGVDGSQYMRRLRHFRRALATYSESSTE